MPKSANNLKPFTLGDWVRVNAVAEMQYNEHQERAMVRRPVEPFHAQVIGLATRQCGHYQRGSDGFYSGDFDFSEASLSVTGTVKVWLVRAGLMNKEIEVDNDDLEIIESHERAPLRRIGVPIFLESET